MNKMIRWFLILAALVGLVACMPISSAQEVQSDKPRIVSPDVVDAELAQLVQDNQAFALDLYRALKAQDGNLFYSPHSISVALAMTYAGARNETARQMAAVMHFTQSQDRLHPAFNALDLALNSRGKEAQGKDSQAFRLNVVNAIWGQRGYEFLPAFLDTLGEHYGSGLRILDFARDPETSRVTINNWVSEQTESRIKDLLPKGIIDEMTRLVLTNAIYFNAAWAHPFTPQETTDGTFYLLDGSEVVAPMMRQTEMFGYAERDGLQVVELPYNGYELSMVIVLPQKGQLARLEDELDAKTLDTLLSELTDHKVMLALPRFKVESELGLAKMLQALGMVDAFDLARADLSGMDGTTDLFIQDVVHKAFVDVDEAGTEAAAATAVVVGLKAAPIEPVVMTVDHPFVFFIRDIQTGAVLFVGRIVDPTH